MGETGDLSVAMMSDAHPTHDTWYFFPRCAVRVRRTRIVNSAHHEELRGGRTDSSKQNLFVASSDVRNATGIWAYNVL